MKILGLCFALLMTLPSHAAPAKKAEKIQAVQDLKFVSCEKSKVGFADLLIGPLNLNARLLDVAKVLVLNISQKTLPLFHQTGLVIVFKDRRTEWWDNTCAVIVGFGSTDVTKLKVTTETKDEVRFELQTEEHVSAKEPGGDDTWVPGRLLKVHLDIVNTKINLEP